MAFVADFMLQVTPNNPNIVKNKPTDLLYFAHDLEITVQYVENENALYFRLDTRGRPRKYSNQKLVVPPN